MGWLIGLPLGLFRMLVWAVLLLVRLAVPILVIVLVVWLLRRRKSRRDEDAPPGGPQFHGPVYTVDYEDVEDEQEGEDHGAS